MNKLITKPSCKMEESKSLRATRKHIDNPFLDTLVERMVIVDKRTFEKNTDEIIVNAKTSEIQGHGIIVRKSDDCFFVR